MRIPFNDLSRSNLINKELNDDILSVVNSGQYINQNMVKLFENRFAEFFNFGFVHSVSSGTSALSLAMKALPLSKNYSILMAANAGGYGRIAAELAGVNSIYCDVNDQGLIDIEKLEQIPIDSYSVVLITHLYGQMSNMNEISSYCLKNGKYLIEDCAQSIGAKFNEISCGNWGDVATFSFYPTKNLGAFGDAGAVVTKDEHLYKRIVSLSQYGWGNRYSIDMFGGENSRMDEIQATVLLHKLDNLPKINERRKTIWKEYEKNLPKNFRIIGRDNAQFVAHLNVLVVDKDRHNFVDYLNNKGIESQIHYPILDTKQAAFKNDSVYLPNSLRLSKSIVSLPSFPELKDSELEYICENLRSYRNDY